MRTGLSSLSARRWAFGYRTKDDRDQHVAVQAGARFLQEHAECFPDGAVPGDPAQVAVLAVKVYGVFLDQTSRTGSIVNLRIAR